MLNSLSTLDVVQYSTKRYKFWFPEWTRFE